jgi:hypothetical protein
MKAPATFRYTGFYDLLCDAIFHHRLAKGCSDSYEMNRHARASISASVLTLECAANCLIAEVDGSAALVADLDKLSLISKCEVCLRLWGGKVLDRGRPEVQKVAELVKARNEFVHMKTKTVQSEVGPMTPEGEFVSLAVSFEGKMWPMLKIPKRPIFWSADSALAVLSAVLSFLSYVMVDLKGLQPDDVFNILVSRVEFGNVVIPTQFDEFITELRGISKYGIDLTFLGYPKGGQDPQEAPMNVTPG